MLRTQTRSLFGGHQAHAADLSAPQQAVKRHLNRPAKPASQQAAKRRLNLQPSTCTTGFPQLLRCGYTSYAGYVVAAGDTCDNGRQSRFPLPPKRKPVPSARTGTGSSVAIGPGFPMTIYLIPPASEVACRSIWHDGCRPTGSDTVETGHGPMLRPQVGRSVARPAPVETSAARGDA